MKPSIEQVFEFGTEIIEKEYSTFVNNREYTGNVYSKRYKIGVIYEVLLSYGYSANDIAKFRNIGSGRVNYLISYSKKNNFNFEEEVNELKDSLDYIYKYTIFDQKKENLQKLYKEENSELSFEDWLIMKL